MRYKVIMSSGPAIELEADEVERVMVAANRRALVICRQGMVNPAHLVSIVAAPDPYEGSNVPKDQRSIEPPLKDLFAVVRAKIGAPPASLPTGERT